MTPQRKRQSQRKVADALWSKVIRREGWCEASGERLERCGGVLQAAHIISRRYVATRYALINGVRLCAAHHVYFTHHPLEWEDWCREQLGSAIYDELRRTALKGGRPEYPALIADLRARLEASAA